MNDCLFCKIIDGQIPSKIIYEDELCVASLDIAPLAPTHFLVVPREHLSSAAEITEQSAAAVGHIFAVIARLAAEQGFSDGYRVVTNVGAISGQTVKHLHFHVLSGKELGSFN